MKDELSYWGRDERMLAACVALKEMSRQAGSFTRAECLEALAWELRRMGIDFERNKFFTRVLSNGFPKTACADFLVDGRIIIMVVCVRRITGSHFEELKRILHVARQPEGYILNAGEPDGPQLFGQFLGQYAPEPEQA